MAGRTRARREKMGKFFIFRFLLPFAICAMVAVASVLWRWQRAEVELIPNKDMTAEMSSVKLSDTVTTSSRSSAPTSRVFTVEDLIPALIQVESGGDDTAIGDRALSDRAYGCLQIREPCVRDVKGALEMLNLRAEDCLGNRTLSIRIFRAYMARYATPRRLGREPTLENMARIWNGGPYGWRKSSTNSYWTKVRREMVRAASFE